MTQKTLLLALGLAVLSLPAAPSRADESPADTRPGAPDFKDVLSLETVGGARISPDGQSVVYTVSSTDWDDNRYDREIFLARQGAEPFQLTRTRDRSSSSPEWSPDSRWIAFLADRGDQTQIYLIRAAGGEAQQLTHVDDGVDDFEWSPDGRFMAVSITEPRDEDDEKREELYGRFAVEDAEYRMTHLWLLDVDKARKTDGGAKLPKDKDEKAEKGDEGESEGETDGESDERSAEDEKPVDEDAEAFRRLTGGDAFTVGGFVFSPDGTEIAFSHRPEPLITSDDSDISVVGVAGGEIRRLVQRPGFDSGPIYSPDGAWILFATSNEKTAYYVNDELAKIPARGGEITVLTAAFDENARAVDWLDDGIRFLAHQKTSRHLFHLDPETGETRQLTEAPRYVSGVDFSADGRTMALVGFSGTSLPEVYLSAARPYEPEPVTAMTDQVREWPEPTTEVVEWTSRDGAAVEGVLIKPADYEPGRRYPLLVIIHGGPAWLSMPQRIPDSVYPVQQWLAKGAVILMPNYRGSTGYGEAFGHGIRKPKERLAAVWHNWQWFLRFIWGEEVDLPLE